MQRLVRGAGAAGVAALLAFAVVAPVHDLVRLVPDDAFYYLEIARRLAGGEGSTFDGLHPTNGYHPLWLALLAPLGPVMDHSRELGLRVALLASIALVAVTLAQLDRLGRRLAPRSGPVGLAWAVGALLPASVYGMEAPLALALLVTLLHEATAVDGATVGRGALVGALSAALVLARLDAVVYVLALDAVWAAALLRSSRRDLRPFLAALACQALPVLVYLAANAAAFGHPLPISGLLKSARHPLGLAWAKSLLALLAVLGTPVALLTLLLRPRVAAPAGRGPVLVAALGMLAHVVLLAAGGNRESYNWYFVLPVLCTAVLLPVLLDELSARGLPRRLGRGAALAAAALLLVVAIRGKLGPSWFHPRLERALWIAANAPADTVFADSDCGMLGYFSERPFVNLDGLTNGWTYQEALRDDRLPEWLDDVGVNAAVLPDDPHQDEVVRLALPAWPGLWSPPRAAHLVLEPWSLPHATPGHRLWRVRRIVDGPPPPPH